MIVYSPAPCSIEHQHLSSTWIWDSGGVGGVGLKPTMDRSFRSGKQAARAIHTRRSRARVGEGSKAKEKDLKESQKENSLRESAATRRGMDT